jgi:hypothetical protein
VPSLWYVLIGVAGINGGVAYKQIEVITEFVGA